NFTDYSLQKTTGNEAAQVDSKLKTSVRLMNPMYFISAPNTSVAQHWYIRHGSLDRDTAFPVPINLATKLQNEGKDVNFKLAWNRPHSGDYALNELFEWMKGLFLQQAE
ncbi:MAG: alpha/beta hydrolase, partial [bacterium]|nr:alpha/beta hydrolase [bacterium]